MRGLHSKAILTIGGMFFASCGEKVADHRSFKESLHSVDDYAGDSKAGRRCIGWLYL